MGKSASALFLFMLAQRLSAAAGASLKHLAASCALALVCAGLVFGLWYPAPYGELVGGRALFLLIVAVDVVCGPLLTLIVWDRRKPRRELWRDIGAIVLIQLLALGYGLASAIQARPVFLAFEGNRFRVVRAPDVEMADIAQAPADLRHLSLSGPRLIGVRLVQPSDPGFPSSIRLALEGLHPAFRPGRWVDFGVQRPIVTGGAQPLSDLRRKHPAEGSQIDAAVAAAAADGWREAELGYWPLAVGSRDDWVVVVDRRKGIPRAFLPLDGW